MVAVKKAPSANKAKPKKAAPKKVKRASGKKNKTVKYHIECKNPVEDGILKTANFVSSKVDERLK